MRLDKYLKVTHLIKRRGQAKDYIDAGYAFLNGKKAKPASEVKVGDRISLGDPTTPKIEVEVTLLKDYCSLDQVGTMYKIVSHEEK